MVEESNVEESMVVEDMEIDRPSNVISNEDIENVQYVDTSDEQALLSLCESGQLVQVVNDDEIEAPAETNLNTSLPQVGIKT